MQQYLVGIDIGGTTVKLGLVRKAAPGPAAGPAASPDAAPAPAAPAPDAARPAPAASPALKVEFASCLPTQPDDPPDVFVGRVADAVRELVARLPAGHAAIAGVGIGCPGLIDPVARCVRKAPNLPNLLGFPLGDRLAQRLGLGVEIQNDANAAALGEWLYGPNRGIDNLVMITLGTGVGGGVVVDGHLLVGADNLAGELGHVKVEFTGGAPCSCGKAGCLEAYAGAAGIARFARAAILSAPDSTRLNPNALTTRQVADAAAAGDGVARRVLDRVGEYLGRGIATFIDIFNPQKVVLAGGASAAIDHLRPGIDRALDAHASFPETRRRCAIERSAFPDDINVLGAAATYLNLHR